MAIKKVSTWADGFPNAIIRKNDMTHLSKTKTLPLSKAGVQTMYVSRLTTNCLKTQTAVLMNPDMTASKK